MEDTIELREIIEILLKGKWIISIFTIATMLFAGVVSWYVLNETYESKAVIQLASDNQDTGIVSNYIAAEFTPTIYMKRIQNEGIMKGAFKEAGYSQFKKTNLTTSNQANTDLVELTYESTSAEESQKHLQLLIEETKKGMDSSLKHTLSQLEQTYLEESITLSHEIEQLMTQYNNLITTNNLPEVLILQTIASSQFVINLTSEQTNVLANINGEMQNQLLQLKVQIDTKAEEYQSVLAKYQSVKTGLDNFKPDPFVRAIIEPTLAEEPSSPQTKLNIVVGLILGLMLGIGFVFFREYWRKSALMK